MVAQRIDGKSIAAKIRAEIAAEIQTKIQRGFRQPGLAVILVGDDPASVIYVSRKREACKEVGIKSVFYPLSNDVSENELHALIEQLNQDKTIDGILLQLPLPDHLHNPKILEFIDASKDVDGFHPTNLGRLVQNHPYLRSCTPLGIMNLLKEIKVPCRGAEAVIIGNSYIVGTPMAIELSQAGCTVTVCQRFTRQLDRHVKRADILISAAGVPHLIKGDWIKEGATVIDVGINRLPNGTLTGDVEFDEASKRAAWITPVPGGVGPMTVAMLLQNTLTAFCNRSENNQLPNIFFAKNA